MVTHDDEGCEHAQRQRDDGDQRRAQVPQEQHTHQRDDQELLTELAGEVAHRGQNQPGAIVYRDDLHALGQTGLQLLYPRLDFLDGGQRVLAAAHHDDPADHLAQSVELGDAAAQGRPTLHNGDITQQHRHRSVRGHHRHPLEIVPRAQVAFAAHHELGLALLDHRAAGGAVGGADRVDQLGNGHAARRQCLRIGHDLPGAHHAADAGDLGDVGHGLELVAQEPVL